MSTDEYHYNIESGITRGMLTTFAKSRRLFEWRYILGNHDNESSDALIEGQLLHTCVLEPEKLDDFQVWDYGQRRGEKWKTFCELCESEGKTIVTKDMSQRCGQMGRAILDEIGTLLTSDVAEKEQTYTAAHDRSGLTLKCRGDLVLPLADRVIAIDLKTTVDETLPEFKWSMKRYKYDWQDVHYSEIMESYYDRSVDFIFLAVRKSAPYTVQRYRIESGRREKTWLDWNAALVALAGCLESGDFSEPNAGRIVEVTF